MPWRYSVSSSTPSYYTWTGTNYLNQHASIVNLPVDCAVTQLKAYFAGYGSSVSSRLAIWNVGGSVLRQTSTFTASAGNTTGGGQYWYTKSITPKALDSGNYEVGIYRSPSGGHIAGTTASGSGTSYRKTNTSTFPNIYSMSGHSSHDKEFYVGVFYITAPNTPSSLSVTRVSDNKMSLSWTNNKDSDQPYDSLKLERYDNKSGNWVLLKTLSVTTSYTDTSTISNRQYRYRLRAYNTAGYSSYTYSSYIYTTPAKVTNLVAERDLSNINLSWDDNAIIENQYRIQINESSDGGDTWNGWGDDIVIASNSKAYIDTSPYPYSKYRVRAEYTTSSLYSDYVESNEVVSITAPNKPTNLTPSTAIDGTEVNTFKWTHNPLDGTAQTKYSLRYVLSGGTMPTTPQIDEQISTVSEHDFATGTFTNGTVIDYQVKTWGEYTDGSDWSDTQTVEINSRPTGTITSPTITSDYGTSSLSVEWEFAQAEGKTQTEFIAILYDENDKMLEKQQRSSSSEYVEFTTSLENNTTYTITLQVKSGLIWSTLNSVEFDVVFLSPVKPEMTLSKSEIGQVTIKINNPAVVGGFSFEKSQDTYIDIVNPDTNYNGNDLVLDYATSSDYKSILIDFDTSEVIGKTVTSANLVLTRKTTLSTAPTSDVRYIKSSWDETTVTYSTLPTIDTTAYDSHLHTAGTTEEWDITTLVQNIANGTITDFEGLYVSCSAVGYDDFTTGTLEIAIDETNVDTEYNNVYRLNPETELYELIIEDVPINTSVTDYTPLLTDDNYYKIEAVSSTPTSEFSDIDNISLNNYGYFIFNTGENYETYLTMFGDTSFERKYNLNQNLISFAGRTRPVKYQGVQIDEVWSFSVDMPDENINTLEQIITSESDIMFRDYFNKRVKCSITDVSLTKKDNISKQFSCTITRLGDD